MVKDSDVSVKVNMVEVEAMANIHDHLREATQPEIMSSLVDYEMNGGVDVIGPQPNTSAGLTTTEEVLRYIRSAQNTVHPDVPITFIPFLMITEQTPLSEIDRAASAGILDAKFYPKFRTTNSGNGIRNYGRLIPAVERCGVCGIRVHLHPEHPNMVYGNRDAEYVFLSIVDMFLNETSANIFWEHGTDGRCIPFWKDMAFTGRFFVTITAHHLVTNEDRILGDVRAVCKPPIKTENDRLALIRLIGDDYPWVMAGPDVAPHDVKMKHVETGCCACGAYTGPFLLPLYAHALDNLFQTPKGIETFVNFTSLNARNVFGLKPASRNIFLVREHFKIPRVYNVGSWKVMPFWAGQEIHWRIKD